MGVGAPVDRRITQVGVPDSMRVDHRSDWAQLLAGTNRLNDGDGIIPFQRLAPVEELDRVEPPLTGHGLVYCSSWPAEALREGPDRQPQFVSPLLEQTGQLLVGAALERLLSGQTDGLFLS